MFLNNFKIALRTLRKNRIYTFINLLGLMVGIAAVLLIFRMVNYELSFNEDFENYDKIVRVVGEGIRPEGKSYSTCIPIPAMAEMESSITQFEEVARVRELWSDITIPNPNGGAPMKKFGLSDGETPFFVTPSFFEIFKLNWLAGDSKTALVEPNSIVVNKTWAEKSFDSVEDAMDQTVLIDNIVPAKIKGVIADLPSNIDFNAPYFVSYKTVENNANFFWYSDYWGSCSSNDQVYALLKDANQKDAANELLADVGKENYTDESGKQRRFFVVQPLSDLHFSENYPNSGTHRMNKTRLKVLSFIGLLILIMACFNFINLATAQAMLRAKEVGVRKTLGSGRGELIGQFMTETGVIVLISVILAANLAVFCMPLLKYVSDVPDALPFLSNPIVIGFLIMIGFIVTILAGLYPAMTLAGYQPVKALNNHIRQEKSGGAAVRKSLVVLQFGIAQALIIGAMITIMQLDYIQSKDLGFNKDLVYTFYFNTDSTTVARQTALKEKVLQIPSVETISLSSDQPFSGNNWRSNWRYASRPEYESGSINMKFCDADYQKTYDIKMLAGKWMDPSDTSRQVVVNKITVDKLGLQNPSEILNQTISMGGRKLTVVGVTDDFHTHSFRSNHEPHLMTTRKDYYYEAGVKIRPDNIKSTIASIQKVYDEVLPEQIFKGDFLDARIANFYQNDDRLANTCRGFGFLAILISCLGLFGLATHAAAQRIKEIGIRKVLGASTSGIIALLSKDFLKLVFVALIIAIPAAYLFMDNWLNDFVFRIDMSWWVFALAGIAALSIAFLTVSYQSIRAALSNPVKSLRSE